MVVEKVQAAAEFRGKGRRERRGGQGKGRRERRGGKGEGRVKGKKEEEN